MSSTSSRLLGCLLLLGACGGGDDESTSDPLPDPVAAGCNALGAVGCALPWPSAIYEIDDDATATGRRLDIAETTLPTNFMNIQVAPTPYNQLDGWSANIRLLMAWETGFDPAPLAPQDHPERSLAAGSPTIVVDLETGERVPHFAEIDAQAAVAYSAPVEEQALIIRPVVRLKPGHRYAAAVTTALTQPDGSPLPVAAGFDALRTGRPTENARLERVRAGYEDVFAALEALDVGKDELVVAWDFTTRSDEPVWRDAVQARDAMLAAAGDGGELITWTIDDDDTTPDDPLLLRLVEGTIDMPCVLSGDCGDDAIVERDGDGAVIVNAETPTVAAPFTMVIPACAAEPANRPLPIVIYGHGLLGSVGESHTRRFAPIACAVVIDTAWRGMSEADLGVVSDALGDVNLAQRALEKLVQGVNQFVVLSTLARGAWVTAEEFQVEGEQLLDPTRVYYYGISQGGIFGGTVMALDPFVTRGILGVPAASYDFFIERSTNWQTYKFFLYQSYNRSKLDAQVLLTLFQTWWDKTDPITFVSHLTGEVDEPLPGVPPKQVLLDVAIGDSQVANIGADLWARTAGIEVLGPEIYQPFGLEVRDGPMGSALTQWDEHRDPTPPTSNTSVEDNDTHAHLRKRERVNEQILHFFATGEIIQTCQRDGQVAACDCTTDEVCGPDPEPPR